MKFIIAMVLLFVLAIIVLMLRSSGPRITTIEHCRDKAAEDQDDDRKDGDDA